MVKDKMNKKIIIGGEKVHHVGYIANQEICNKSQTEGLSFRPLLMAKARRLKIPNYESDNVKEGGKQKVIVSFGGEEKQVQEFAEFIKGNYPPEAKVLDVKEAEPPESVMPIDEYQKILDTEQHDTMVQAGLGMIKMQGKTIEMQKQTIDEVKTVGEKIDIGFEKTDQDFKELRQDYGEIYQTMEKILGQMTQQQKDFTDAINGLTKAILTLAEKAS